MSTQRPQSFPAPRLSGSPVEAPVGPAKSHPPPEPPIRAEVECYDAAGRRRADSPGRTRQRLEEHDLDTHRVWVLRDATGIVTVVSVARQDEAAEAVAGPAPPNGDTRRTERCHERIAHRQLGLLT